MITMMIADDEHYICTYIATLMQSQDWDLDIHTAYSGTEVLEALDETVFHLMLLDIDMPGATGLEVAKEVIKRYPRTRILFLSAYDNFDYIYSAMSIKCQGYILKIEPEQVILAQIGKIIEEILEEQRNMLRTDEIQRKDQLLSFYNQQNVFHYICFGQTTEQVESKIRRLPAEQAPRLNVPFYLMYTRYVPAEDHTGPTLSSDDFLLQHLQLMRSLLCGKLQCFCLRCDEFSFLYFFQPLASTSALTDFIFLRRVADEYITTLSAAKAPAQEAVVLFMEPLLHSQISDIFPKLKAYGDAAHPEIDSYVTFVDRKGLDRFSKDLTEKGRPAKNEQILKRIQTYIEENYASKLTLSLVASLVNYNESYISRLFKKETGQGVIEYITAVRLNKAKELLTTTKMSVQDIALTVGFDAPQYFSSTFRKQEGVSPTEYRLSRRKPGFF